MALKHKILRVRATIVNRDPARIGLTAGARVAAAGAGDDGEDLAAIIYDVIERRLDLVRRSLELGALGCGLRDGELLGELLLGRPSI
jgi:hypothetical protein